MNKFILAVIMFFSMFAANAGSFNGEIGLQSKVLYQGQQLDVSTVNPYARVGFTDSVGFSLAAGVQSTKADKVSVQGLSDVTLAYTKDFYSVYATRFAWLGNPTAKDFGVAGVKLNYKGLTASVESSSLNSQYGSVGYSHNVGNDTVSGLVSAKTYQGGKAVFNNAEVRVSTPFYGSLVSAVGSYGGKDAFGVKLPNQASISVAYLF